MALKYKTYTLGALQNNTYIVYDEDSRCALLIDPADSTVILKFIHENSLKLNYILVTHAHFDHIHAVNEIRIAKKIDKPKVGLHKSDRFLWQSGAGARAFGLVYKSGELPEMVLNQNQKIECGNHFLEVRHTPGHTAGHVIFYSLDLGAVFCGDLIFYKSIGRTDLEGGNEEMLLKSIREQVLTLPDSTLLLPGHGPATTIGFEKQNNPFLFSQ